ncbi:MAG: hypothetical protein LBR46_04640 [Prevotella sp.]|jgi:hypothetical protein|nr:hypothetical protein [Prevotella sp.]
MRKILLLTVLFHSLIPVLVKGQTDQDLNVQFDQANKPQYPIYVLKMELE